MPNISVTVTGVQESILRPIIFDMVRQIEEITKIPKDSQILFPGDLERTYQPGSTLDPDKERTKFMNNDMVQIEVDEDFYHDSVMSTAVTMPEQLPIFNDTDLGVFIKPIYVTTAVSINYKFRSKSKTTLIRWRNDIRIRTSMMREMNLHKITYSYGVPADITRVLKEIHRLRENISGYGEDFVTYLFANATTRLTEISNLSASTTRLAIAESQMRIVGYFDFEGYPDKPEHDDDSGTWTTGFTYKFTYEKPIACNMSYPVLIHNQVLGPDYRPIEDSYSLDTQLKSYSQSINAFNYFEAQLALDRLVTKNSTLNIPAYDIFTPPTTPYGCTPVVTVLCSLAPTDLRNLFNLGDLDLYTLDQYILDFLRRMEWAFITGLYKSLLQLWLYEGKTLVASSILSIDNKLNIISNIDLDIRKTYRVMLSLVSDLSLLTQEVLDRLKKEPIVLVKLFSALDNSLATNQGFQALAKKTYISRNDLLNFDISIDGGRRKFGQRTVMQYGIIARDGINTASKDIYLGNKEPTSVYR